MNPHWIPSAKKQPHKNKRKKWDFGTQEPPKWFQMEPKWGLESHFFQIGETLILWDPTLFWHGFWPSRGPGINWKRQGNRTWKKHTKKHEQMKACSKKHENWSEDSGDKLFREFTFFWPGCCLAPFWSQGRFKTSFRCQNDKKMEPKRSQGPQNSKRNAEKLDGI